MSKAGENGFTVLETELPCCGKVVSLNDLDYHFPCGFACCVISILNPSRNIGDCTLADVQEIIGVSIRVIKTHI